MSEASTRDLLRDAAHRPYALPSGMWLGRQSWQDLLLAHWPVPIGALKALLPKPFEPDTHDGVAWVSVVAFRMANVRLRGIPQACGLDFPELNVRTYVRHAERSGVFSLSLDATNPL